MCKYNNKQNLNDIQLVGQWIINRNMSNQKYLYKTVDSQLTTVGYSRQSFAFGIAKSHSRVFLSLSTLGIQRFLKIPLQVSYSFEKQLKSTTIRRCRNRIESHVQEDWKTESIRLQVSSLTYGSCMNGTQHEYMLVKTRICLCKRGEVILYCDSVYNFFQNVNLYISFHNSVNSQCTLLFSK